MPKEWAAMGGKLGNETLCSEWDLWSLNRPDRQKVFKKHWETWLTEADVKDLVGNYGVNLFRIPIGYWIVESLTYSHDRRQRDPLPTGGYPYLVRALKWIKKAGAYAILDLHGAPGVQVKDQQFTGHCTSTPGFYTPHNYNRALEWARNMTILAHRKGAGVVIGIQAVNEPAMDTSITPGLQQYYKDFAHVVRKQEKAMGYDCTSPTAPTSFTSCLNLIYMDHSWQNSFATTSNLIPAADPSLACIGPCISDSHNYACQVPAANQTLVEQMIGLPPGSFNTLQGYQAFATMWWYLADSKRNGMPLMTGEWSVCNNWVNASVEEVMAYREFQEGLYGSNAGLGSVFWNFKVEGDQSLRGQWDYRTMRTM
ncbi:hypothetical protein HDV00_000744 [Rhizophlyctis rosea]|nr:hypothetical protein HDV00_000744 [Rhizophlyctis rosea]